MGRRASEAELRQKLAKSEFARKLAESEANLRVAEAERKASESEFARKLAESEAARKLAESNTVDAKKQDVKSKAAERDAKDRRKRRFPWLHAPAPVAIPDDALGHILSFLHDDQLFEIRGLSSTAYFAFLNQRVVMKDWRGPDLVHSCLHSYRAVKLAKMGRVFPRVECLNLYGRILENGNEELWHDDEEEASNVLSAEDIAAITPKAFPALASVKLGYYSTNAVDLGNLPPHPSLTHLSVEKVQGFGHLTPERFPKLEVLHLVIPFESVTKLPAHPKIAELTLVGNCELPFDQAAYDHITKTNFPGLREVTVQLNDEDLPETNLRFEERAEDEGFELYLY